MIRLIAILVAWCVATAPASSTAPPQATTGQAPTLTVPRDVHVTRGIVMFYDTAHETPAQLHVSALGTATWVDEKMAPGDFVAIATPGDPPRIWSGFTSDKTTLHATIGALDRAVVDSHPDARAGISNATVLRAMASLCQSLSAVRGKRILMFFSAGLPSAGADAVIDRRATERTCITAGASIDLIDPASLNVRGGDVSR